MKKIMITLALACGIFTAASAAKNEKPWANGKLQVSANQRFLQFENGQPFFMLGDTGWLLPERLDRAEAQYYLQKCRVAGVNTVLIQVMDGTPSFNIYGQQSLPAGWDLSKADPAGVYSYWDHLDYIIKLAEMNGIRMIQHINHSHMKVVAMITVALDEIRQVFLMPFIEETGIIAIRFLAAPHVETLVHHEETHRIAHVQEFWCRRIMTASDSVHAHIAKDGKLTVHRILINGSTP